MAKAASRSHCVPWGHVGLFPVSDIRVGIHLLLSAYAVAQILSRNGLPEGPSRIIAAFAICEVVRVRAFSPSSVGPETH